MAQQWAGQSRGAGASVSACPPSFLASLLSRAEHAGAYDSIVVETAGKGVEGGVLGQVSGVPQMGVNRPRVIVVVLCEVGRGGGGSHAVAVAVPSFALPILRCLCEWNFAGGCCGSLREELGGGQSGDSPLGNDVARVFVTWQMPPLLKTMMLLRAIIGPVGWGRSCSSALKRRTLGRVDTRHL